MAVNQKVWIMFSVYKQDDARSPVNWATAIFANEEHAKAAKEITEQRTDIKEVFIQENNIQTEAWKVRPPSRMTSWRERIAAEHA